MASTHKVLDHVTLRVIHYGMIECRPLRGTQLASGGKDLPRLEHCATDRA